MLYNLVDDLTDMDLQKKKSYRDIIKDAKANDKRYKLRNGKLVIDGKLYIPEKENTQSNNKSNRKAMNRNWGNQNANPALKTKTGNK